MESGTAARSSATEPASERSAWRAVALPSEHGGWGLTLEPVLLGLLVAWSWSGLALGVAAFVAFVARTPLKLALIDRRRGRDLPRTRLARRIAAAELSLLATLGTGVALAAGTPWLWAVVAAAPLVLVESWYDLRARSRRLLPELAGAIGIAAVAAAIVLAGGGDRRLAAGAWVVLAGRSVCSIPYVRTQIARARRGTQRLTPTDAWQVAGIAGAMAATSIDSSYRVGAVAVIAVAVAQSAALRRPPPSSIKVVGLRQMAAGLAVVIAAAAGVHL